MYIVPQSFCFTADLNCSYIYSSVSHFTRKAVIFTPAYVRLILDYSQPLYFFHPSHGKGEKEGGWGGGGGGEASKASQMKIFLGFHPLPVMPSSLLFCAGVQSSSESSWIFAS